MNRSEPLVYLNGQTLPASQAHLAIYDAGVVMGATVSEQARTFRHQPFRLEQHLDRLFQSLQIVGFDPGLTRDRFRSVSLELVDHNARLLEAEDELGLIQFVTAGELASFAGRGVRPGPTVCIHTFPLPFERWARLQRDGARLVTPSIRQVPPQSYDPRMKYRSRMHFYLADQEARRVDPEALALLLDLDGSVVETSSANVFIVERGAIVTPTTRNALAGISRSVVREVAETLAIPFAERDLPLDNVLEAGEAFLSSTPYCLTWVAQVNGRTIGTGKPGPVFRRLIDAWSNLVGVDVEAQMQDGARRRAAGGTPSTGIIPANEIEYWASLGRFAKVRQAIESGFDVNEKGESDYTGLHAAAENGHLDVMLLLIEHGAEVNARCISGETPLDLAKDENTARLLRDHGARRGQE